MTPDDPGSPPPSPSPGDQPLPSPSEGDPFSASPTDPDATATYRARPKRPPAGRRPPEPSYKGWVIAGIVALLALAGFLIWYLAFRSSDTETASDTVALSSSSVDFGDEDLGKKSAAQTVTLTNSGSTAVGIAKISIQGTDKKDFGIPKNGTTCTTEAPLNGDESCTVSVRFKPKARGDRTASLVISFDAGAAPASVALSGTGTGNPAVVVETTRLDFGSVKLGKTEARKVSITNAGNAPLAFEGFSVQGAAADSFTITNKSTCSTDTKLKAGAACTIAVSFKPAEVGQANAMLVVKHDAQGSPAQIELRGTGVGQPKVQLPTKPVDFGPVDVDTQSDPQTVTLRNTGTGQLSLEAIGISGPNQGDFTIGSDGTCSTEKKVAPGATCTIEIVFQPSTAGDSSALLTVATNAKQSIHQVPLEGTGTGGQTVTTE